MLLDDADYRTHWVLAAVLRAKADFDGAHAAYERAYGLNANDADLAADFGAFHVYWGEPAEAVRRIEGAMRLNPLYPDWYLGGNMNDWHRHIVGRLGFNSRRDDTPIGISGKFPSHQEKAPPVCVRG